MVDSLAAGQRFLAQASQSLAASVPLQHAAQTVQLAFAAHTKGPPMDLQPGIQLLFWRLNSAQDALQFALAAVPQQHEEQSTPPLCTAQPGPPSSGHALAQG